MLAIGKAYKAWNGRKYLCLNSFFDRAVLRDIESGRHFMAYEVREKNDDTITWTSSGMLKSFRVDASLDDRACRTGKMEGKV